MTQLMAVRQILNLFRDMIFVWIYSGKIPWRKKKLSVLGGYLALVLTLVMYTAEGQGIFTYATVRMLYRTMCYFLFLYGAKELSASHAFYDALYLNTICTIVHNFFLTPLTRPILLNTFCFTKNPYFNWLFCFLIVNLCSVLCYGVLYYMVPLQKIRHINKTRIASMTALMIGCIYLNNTLRSITDLAQTHVLEVSTYAIILQAALFACVILMEVIQWKNEEQTEARIQSVNAMSMLENVKKQKENDEKTRQLRHDLKNHLQSIYYLVSENKKDDCLKYLEQLMDTYTKPTVMIHSGNSLIDHMVSQKLNQAVEKNIMISFTADFSPITCLRDADVCTIFGNLLDNAIEAAEKVPFESERFIDIRSTVKGNQYIFRMENSFCGSLDKKDSVLRTTKEDKRHHGIGLKSASNLVRKYNGILDYTDKDKVFRVTVLFPIVKN